MLAECLGGIVANIGVDFRHKASNADACNGAHPDSARCLPTTLAVASEERQPGSA